MSTAVEKVSVSGGTYGQATITASAIRLTDEFVQLKKGVLIHAIDGTVYVGFDADVSSVTGMPIAQGAYVSVPCESLSSLYLISAGTVAVAYMGA